jgi:hypothetical protein
MLKNFSVNEINSESSSDAYITLIYMLALIAPAFEILQGFIYGGDVSKSFSNVFSLISVLLIVVMFMSSALLRLKRAGHVYSHLPFLDVACYLWTTLTFAIIVMNGLYYGKISYDIFAILRSLILGYAVYSLSLKIDDKKKATVLRNCALYLWILISGVVFVSRIFSIGLYTYPEFEIGNKFFFPSVNELTYVYFSSWLIVSLLVDNTAIRYLLLSVTILVFLIIGCKSFVAFFIVVLLFLFWQTLSFIGKFFLTSIFLSICFACIVTDIFNIFLLNVVMPLASILASFSSGGEKLLLKLSYLSVFSALVSERDVLVSIAHDLFIHEYDFFDFLFGKSLSGYGPLYAIKKGVASFSFSEVDLVDLFMSYGLNGCFLFLVIIFKMCHKKASSEKSAFYKTRALNIIIFVLAGTFTGHVFFFSFTCFTFALYTGLLSIKNSSNLSTRASKA